MRKVYKKLLVLAGFLLLISCNYRSSTMGYQDRIFVFADSLLWLKIKDSVEVRFKNYIHTPRAEPSFGVEWRPLSQLNDLKKRMNIFFIGTTQSGSPVNDYLLQAIPQNFIQSVKEDKNFYFFKDDLFARGQISLFMLANDAQSFLKNFEQLSGTIYDAFNAKYMKRLTAQMFERGEQFELEKFLADNYGYKVRVEHDYFLATEDESQKYVWLRRMDPDRWLSVWRVSRDSSLLNFDSLKIIRNKMARQFYGGDIVVEDETKFKHVNFLGQKTTKMTGTWRNDSLLIGGPFRTYAVYQPQKHFIYLIDLAVMAPDERKKPYLDQLEVIASTFEFVNPDSVHAKK